KERKLAARYGIEDLPTFVLIVRGQEVQRHVGAMSESQLRRMAQRIPTKSRKPAERSAATSPREQVKSDGGLTIIRANNAEPPETGEVTRNPMDVCVRIRVRDSRGLDIGSGSIIHSEPGRTLILTCGHIFRHFDGKSEIEVDIFTGQRAVSHKGKLIRKDLNTDIGLISIQTLTPLRVARVSPAAIRQGQHVFSVGCGGGDPPSRLQHRVTSTDRYKGGYIECTGTPIQGRSGGGLFTPDGQIVGVCVFANPGSRRGLYTGLPTIHALLDRVGLTSLYKEGPTKNPIKLVGAETTATTREEPVFEEASSDEEPAKEAPKELELQPVKSSSAASLPSDVIGRIVCPLPDEVNRALREARGSEVVCIIRPRNNPNAPSRVVIIHEASEQFVSELTGELHSQIRPASVEVRRPAASEVADPDPSMAAFYGEPESRSRSTTIGPSLPLPQPRARGTRTDVRRYQRTRR
ncbi:MAG: trypsin-like peptidase domain-containing protein, partial [Planctomycetes bacterium]|nr:trypsin-like peptidase domain-containing protein [Planctomycetota bacterium]